MIQQNKWKSLEFRQLVSLKSRKYDEKKYSFIENITYTPSTVGIKSKRGSRNKYFKRESRVLNLGRSPPN